MHPLVNPDLALNIRLRLAGLLDGLEGLPDLLHLLVLVILELIVDWVIPLGVVIMNMILK